MEKDQIISLLEIKHNELLSLFSNPEKESWEFSPKDRWTTGQHISHLVNSLILLNKALRYPKFILKYKFGTSNRPSRSYEEVKEKYLKKLNENKDRAKKFNQSLEKPVFDDAHSILDELQIQNKKLQYKTKRLKDKHLDTLLIPHPLMGRMTLREIIMWTAYHTEHHKETLKKDYNL